MDVQCITYIDTDFILKMKLIFNHILHFSMSVEDFSILIKIFMIMI